MRHRAPALAGYPDYESQTLVNYGVLVARQGNKFLFSCYMSTVFDRFIVEKKKFVFFFCLLYHGEILFCIINKKKKKKSL